MDDKFLLLLLAPYALFLLLALRRLRSRIVPTILLGCLTVVVVWLTLYIVFCVRPFSSEAGADDAFATVDQIMRSVEADWMARYFIPRLGWLVSIVFFAACWAVARLLPTRKSV